MIEGAQMKFEIGDKVKFMSEKGGGIIRRFTSRDMAIVEIEEGFEIPVRISELIMSRDNMREDPNKPETSSPSQEEQQPLFSTKASSVAKPLRRKDDPGSSPVTLLLGFVPRNPESMGGSTIDLFLVNDSKYHILFCLCQEQSGIGRLVTEGNLEPETQEHLMEYHQSELGKVNAFTIQALLYHKGEFRKISPLEARIDISDIKFHKEKHYRENDYFDASALLFEVNSIEKELHHDSVKDSRLLAEHQPKDKDLQSSLQPPKKGDFYEIDLHIEALTDQYLTLQPGEILNLQMSRFNSIMEMAHEKRWKKVVFIHGVGDGRLQFELRKVIDKKYPDTAYQDASFLEYGYGATLVLLA